MGVTRKQSAPNFAKNEHVLPTDKHTFVCISGGKKSSFLKIWRALLSCYHHFEICHFTDDIQVKRCPTSILT